MSDSLPVLWTVGHSTRTLDAFLAVLADALIGTVVDVRRFPGSRRHPHFAGDALACKLPRAGVAYVPMPALGGRRAPRADSPNTAWRNPGFRGYADYMESAEFGAAVARLATLARTTRTAVMCAEALWWQCHRGLIADRFKVDGWEVVHLGEPGAHQSHPYTPAARIVDGALVYWPEPPVQPMLL